MINLKNLFVGKLLFVTFYDGRKTTPIGMRPIEKVGRKYFYLKPYSREEKFEIESGLNSGDYSMRFCLYESEEAYKKTLDQQQVISKARNIIRKLYNKNINYEEALLITKKFDVES